MTRNSNKIIYHSILKAVHKNHKLLAILIDPDKFELSTTKDFFNKIPESTNYLFVGGSEVENGRTEQVVNELKKFSKFPVILFPGNVNQITDHADGILFLSLLSGQNPEYLINQQVKSISKLQHSSLEIIPTGYILVDGGIPTSVLKVSQTKAIPQNQISTIVNTALAGQFSGKQLIYLEAGSGASYPVSAEIISEVKKNISIPLIVGGGIKTELQKEAAYQAGADLIVMGNAFEL
jgi:putative glycerol-1-phosphate prenyltransferase